MGISGDSYLFCGSRVLPPYWEEVTFEELGWGHPGSLSSFWRVVGVHRVVLGIWACVLPQESWPKSYFFFLSCSPLLQSCIFLWRKRWVCKIPKSTVFVLFFFFLPHLTTSLTRDWTRAPFSGSAGVPTIVYKCCLNVISSAPIWDLLGIGMRKALWWLRTLFICEERW